MSVIQSAHPLVTTPSLLLVFQSKYYAHNVNVLHAYSSNDIILSTRKDEKSKVSLLRVERETS